MTLYTRIRGRRIRIHQHPTRITPRHRVYAAQAAHQRDMYTAPATTAGLAQLLSHYAARRRQVA